MTHIYDQYGMRREMADIMAVQRLEDLKKKSSTPWPVIEECFTLWKSKNPKKWDAHLVHIQETKDTRRDKKYAWNSKKGDPKHGGILRYTLDIPEPIMQMIRCIYSVEELPMNRTFFHEFARRFPSTKIAEKL